MMYCIRRFRSTAASLLTPLNCASFSVSCKFSHKPQDDSHALIQNLASAAAIAPLTTAYTCRSLVTLRCCSTTIHVSGDMNKPEMDVDERYERLFGAEERKRKQIELKKAERLEHIKEKQSKSPEQYAQIIFERLVAKQRLIERDYAAYDVIRFLVEDGFHRDDIEYGIKRHVYVFRNQHVEKWKSAVGVLKENGFRGDDIMVILVKNRRIFDSSKTAINEMIYALRQVFAGDRRMRIMCAHLPVLFSIPIEFIESQFNELNELFTKRDLYSLLDRTPAMLLDDVTDDIKPKLDYVLKVMNVPESKVAKTYLFKHTMQHIIMRCEFLTKSGLYVRPDKHGHAPILNATLREIVDTSESDYCLKIAKCREEEFQAFCNMFDIYDNRSQLRTVSQEESALQSDGDEEDDVDDDDVEVEGVTWPLDDDDVYYLSIQKKRSIPKT